MENYSEVQKRGNIQDRIPLEVLKVPNVKIVEILSIDQPFVA